MDGVFVKYQFGEITDALKEDLKSLVEKNLQEKMSAYLAPIFEKEGAEIHLEYKIDKTANSLYSGIFSMAIDGQTLRYEREDFVKPDDLVNHAFDHFKESLAQK